MIGDCDEGLAARFGAEGWREIQSPCAAALLRARLLDDDVAVAIGLRADPVGTDHPQITAAALAQVGGSTFVMPGEAVMEREADLAARIAAELRV